MVWPVLGSKIVLLLGVRGICASPVLELSFQTCCAILDAEVLILLVIGVDGLELMYGAAVSDPKAILKIMLISYIRMSEVSSLADILVR